jgi:SAM-dependent methyltransferase
MRCETLGDLASIDRVMQRLRRAPSMTGIENTMEAVMQLAKSHSDATNPGVLPHNEKAGATWGATGHNYERISEIIADAIDHVVMRVVPQPGETFLGVATGTGWTARRLAARGAKVVGVDIGAGVIAAAKALAPQIDFRVGDAEALPFPDASFDGVTSTFGVMFAARQEDAARELARVCKKGGRLGICTWRPGDTVEAMFKMMKPYMPPPPANPPPSPFEWGRPERVRQLLGDAFDLKFESGVTTLRMPSGQSVWNLFVEAYGPTKALAAGCNLERRTQLEHDFVAFHDQYRSELGVDMPRAYLVAIGTRK